ncbi:MAG: hypothetical protein GX139_05565 [Armatimonadetes bacterium]|nr:hypothetical protein [Armatimonadota bacterium]
MFRLAKWIWVESLLDTPNCYIYARREFRSMGVADAEVSVCCTSEYALYVNGRCVGRGSDRSCGTDGQYYNTHDVSHIIRPGKNVIAAICHANTNQAQNNNSNGFILKLTQDVDGREHTIVTDKSWRLRAGCDWDFNSARLGGDIGYQEVYDSRKRPVGWNVVGFDDSEWEPPAIISEQGSNSLQSIKPREIPPLKEHKIFPQVISGYGTITATDNQFEDIAYKIAAEPLRRDSGRIKYVGEMLTQSGDAAIAAQGDDCFIILDFGSLTVGHFGLKIRSAGTAVIDIGYDETLDAAGKVDPTRGGINQADRLQLHGGRQSRQTYGRRVFRYVQLSIRNLNEPISIEFAFACSIGYPVEQKSSFECSDKTVNDLWQDGVHILSLYMQETYEPDLFAGRICHPASARIQALANYYCFFDFALAAGTLANIIDDSPSDPIWLSMMHDYLLYTSDLGFVGQYYGAIQSYIRQIQSQKPHHNLSRALGDASRLAKALSRVDDAMEWHNLAKNCPKPSQTDYGLYALQELVEQDKVDEALELLRTHWKNTQQTGAHSWWSTSLSEDDPGIGADCLPVYFLSAEILGVKPALPGKGEVIIQPRPGSLQWAKGSVETIVGKVDVVWRMEDGVFSIEVEYLGDFSVALPIHRFEKPLIDEIDLTPETPARRARKTYGWGTTIWRDNTERDPYLDWLQTQESRPPADYQQQTRCDQRSSYIWVRNPISNHVRYEIREG